jgi:hypothetical protein
MYFFEAKKSAFVSWLFCLQTVLLKVAAGFYCASFGLCYPFQFESKIL